MYEKQGNQIQKKTSCVVIELDLSNKTNTKIRACAVEGTAAGYAISFHVYYLKHD